MRQVVRFTSTAVEGVAWPSLQQTGWHSLGNFQRMKISQVGYQLALFAAGLALRSDHLYFAIRHYDVQFAHVVGGGTIHWGMRPTRIVGDHPSDSRPRTGCDIRPKTKAVRTKKMV